MSRLITRLRAVAFDLDGTLVDSAPDIARAVNHVLGGCGADPLPVARIVGMIGDGIHTLVERALAASLAHPPSATDTARLAEAVVERYSSEVYVDSRVYAGVREGLTALRDAGLPLFVVTNKISRLSHALLAACGLAPLIDHVLCADDAAARKPAPLLLARACGLAAARPAQLLMVGDSRADVMASAAVGCHAAVVTYGYGARDALAAGPGTPLASVADIASLESADASLA